MRGDFGKSYTSDESVNSILARALPNSAKLALLAFVLMIPLAFLGGLISALKAYQPTDRVISIGGLSLTVVPEFVSALLAIVIFGIVLGWLPVSARWPDGRRPPDADQVPPAAGARARRRALRLRLAHGARRHDRGARRRLHAHGRTSRASACGRCMFEHVLRNALLPTIAVVATQIGYLLGGLVIVERAFNYPGLGRRSSATPCSRTTRSCRRARW